MPSRTYKRKPVTARATARRARLSKDPEAKLTPLGQIPTHYLDGKEISYTPVFKKNKEAQARTVINIGGARSSKSHSIAQLLLEKALREPGTQIGITRKTMPALRMTAYRLFVELAQSYGVYQRKQHSRTENFLTLGEGSRVQFFSLDNPERIKSTEFNYLWLEEANEFTFDDYIILLTRLSAKPFGGARNQLFLSLNPSDANGWIPKRLLPQKETLEIRSTYKDNPFVGTDYGKILEDLKHEDENHYRVYALGEWGVPKDLIYSKYSFVEELPQSYDEVIWGLDFGYNNPSALVKIAVRDGALFVQEKLYRSRLNTADLIAQLQELIPPEERGGHIYADSAEPDKIAELAAAGFNITGADKAVRHGIDMVSRFKLHLTRDSANLIKEIQNYKWKTAPGGVVLDEPVKFNDHALDALRYAVRSYFRTLPPPWLTIIG